MVCSSGYTCPDHHWTTNHLYTNDEFTGVDPKQLERVALSVPDQCDHSPEKCNSCWKMYPQSCFPNWTKKLLEKTKIYKIIHNYSKFKPCSCYQVDLNNRGFFTHAKITVMYGDEDTLWNNLIHEHVSCSYCICCTP